MPQALALALLSNICMTDGISFSEFANAKINLNLTVLGKRPDGYHALDSLVVFALLGDSVSVSPSDDITLTYAGTFAAELQASFAPDAEDLVLTAARMLRAESGVTTGAALQLHKSVPLGAGLGGGSADAAACLRLLNSFWKLDWSLDALMALGARIGSDVPACVMNTSCRMTGRGEHVEKVENLPSLFCVLVNPGVHVSTAEIFRQMNKPQISADIVGAPLQPFPDFSIPATLYAYLEATGNDLLMPAIAAAPVIQDVLAALNDVGADISAMTGSGSTCFGLFLDEKAAQRAQAKLKGLFPDYWVEATLLKTTVLKTD